METVNRQDLYQKIDQLFVYRQIPWMLQVAGMKQPRRFYGKLKELQAAIYDLDHTLESNWKVEPSALRQNWGTINDHLDDFGLSSREREGLTAAIRKYEEHELGLRHGLSPVDLDMEYLYFYKSCDVKLMRALIYREMPALEEVLPQRDWLAYDMITELNDDIEDMFEDISTFNGNRIIFEVAVLGADATYRHYRQYLEQVTSEYRQQQVAPPELGASRKVYELTLKAANDTLDLLSHQFAREDVGDISRARVLKKFKYKST
jgi:hypothetical protein